MLNKNMLGYCIPGNNNLHVCGRIQRDITSY